MWFGLASLVDSHLLSTLCPAGPIFVLPDYKAVSYQRLRLNITGRFNCVQVLLRWRQMWLSCIKSKEREQVSLWIAYLSSSSTKQTITALSQLCSLKIWIVHNMRDAWIGIYKKATRHMNHWVSRCPGNLEIGWVCPGWVASGFLSSIHWPTAPPVLLHP